MSEETSEASRITPWHQMFKSDKTREVKATLVDGFAAFVTLEGGGKRQRHAFTADGGNVNVGHRCGTLDLASKLWKLDE